jgi:hypothetical protein
MGGPCARPVHVNLSNITCINPRFLSANCANLFIVRYRSQNIKAGGYRRPEKFSSLHILVRQKTTAYLVGTDPPPSPLRGTSPKGAGGIILIWIRS